MCTFQVFAAQVQVLEYSTNAQTPLSLSFVSLPGPSSSGGQVLGKHSHPQVGSTPSQTLGFLCVQWTCLLRCAMCLFWGADLWLQPSQQMATVQNPKNFWLATEPACSLVEDSSLGQRLLVSSSGCPPHLSPPACLQWGMGWSTAC